MTLYDIVFNAVIIIYLIDNNLLMFISDYKILLIKALNDFYKNNISNNFIINDSIPIIFNASDLLAYKDCHNIFITIDKSIKMDDIKKLGIKYYMCRGDCGGCQNCFKTNNHITLCYKH